MYFCIIFLYFLCVPFAVQSANELTQLSQPIYSINQKVVASGTGLSGHIYFALEDGSLLELTVSGNSTKNEPLTTVAKTIPLFKEINRTTDFLLFDGADVNSKTAYLFTANNNDNETSPLVLARIDLTVQDSVPQYLSLGYHYGLETVNLALVDPSTQNIFAIGKGNSENSNQVANVVIKVSFDAPFQEDFPLPGYDDTNNKTLSYSFPAQFDGLITAGCMDTDGIAYIAVSSDPPKIIKANMLPPLDEDGYSNRSVVPLQSLSLPSLPSVDGGLCDMNRKFGYFYNSQEGEETTVVKVDLNTMTIVKSVQLGSNAKKISAAVIDTVGGQAYFGNTVQESYVSHVGLGLMKNRIATSELELKTPTSSHLRSAAIDISNGNLYFATDPGVDPNGTIIALQTPPPCLTCNNRGNCVYGVCDCTAPVNIPEFPYSPGWTGETCTELRCPSDCSAHGTCYNGTCSCDEGYNQRDCANRICPNLCSGNGVCNEETYTCECDPGWGNDDCSVIEDTCLIRSNADACLELIECGWCRSESKCYRGTKEGPLAGGCLSWYHFDKGPEVGIEVFAYIITGFAVMMLLVDIVSAFREDKNTPAGRPDDIDIRSSWWRNQRSAKTWALIDQIQFAAITGQFATKNSTLYYSFVTIFRWSLIGFGLPWSQNKAEDKNGRQLMSMKQYTSSIIAYEDEVFFGSLFWLALLVGLALLVFAVIALVNLFVGSKNIKIMLRNRIIYTLLRISLFAYFPFAVFTTWTMYLGHRAVAGAVISAAFLLIVHLGWFALIIFVIPRKKQDSMRVFQPNYLKKFGMVYNSFYFKRSWFLIIVLARKLLIGAFVGFLQEHQIVQLVLLIIVHVFYLASLFIFKPFLDHVHFFVDVACSIINIIVIGLMFIFLDDVNIRDRVSVVISGLITAALLVSQVICIGAFFDNWLRLNNIRGFKDLIRHIRQGKQNHGDNVNTNNSVEIAEIATTKKD